MTTLAAQFAIVGRLYAIRRALDYDLRGAGRRVEVPREVWDAIMRAWRIAGGGDGR